MLTVWDLLSQYPHREEFYQFKDEAVGKAHSEFCDNYDIPEYKCNFRTLNVLINILKRITNS